MALIKEIPWKYNMNIAYWMISDIDVSKVENKTKLNVYGYLNKQVRTENIKDVLGSQHYEFDGINYTIEQLYSKIKESTFDEENNEIFSFFQNATDDI